MGLKTGVWEDKTKPMENEKWIDDGQKTGEVDRRAPPEQGERNDFGRSRDSCIQPHKQNAIHFYAILFIWLHLTATVLKYILRYFLKDFIEQIMRR